MPPKAIPEHGACLVCGSQNPHGFGMAWHLTAPGEISGRITLTTGQQGPPDYAHGGASAALLDEAMGLAVWSAGHPVVVANLSLNYHKPVPLGEEVEVWGRVTMVEEGEKVVRAAGEICLADGETAVSAAGLFVRAPRFFENSAFYATLNLKT